MKVELTLGARAVTRSAAADRFWIMGCLFWSDEVGSVYTVFRRRIRKTLLRYHVRRRVYRLQRRATRRVLRRIGL